MLIHHDLLPLTFDSFDEHGDNIETLYNATFIQDFGVFKKDEHYVYITVDLSKGSIECGGKKQLFKAVPV